MRWRGMSLFIILNMHINVKIKKLISGSGRTLLPFAVSLSIGERLFEVLEDVVDHALDDLLLVFGALGAGALRPEPPALRALHRVLSGCGC